MMLARRAVVDLQFVPTANEKKALWFLALVALSGSGVRVFRGGSDRPTAAEAAALNRQLERVDSVRALRHMKSGEPRQTRKPLRDSAVDNPTPARAIDLDRASTQEIEALPGIGPALASRIVAARDSAGAFGAIEALCDVSGIGPALVAKLRPLVTFSGPRRPLNDACGEPRRRPRTRRDSRTHDRR